MRERVEEREETVLARRRQGVRYGLADPHAPPPAYCQQRARQQRWRRNHGGQKRHLGGLVLAHGSSFVGLP